MSIIHLHGGGAPRPLQGLGQYLAVALFGLILASTLAIVILPRSIWLAPQPFDVEAETAMASQH